MTLASVKDGLANTLLILKSARDNGPWARGGPSSVRGLDPSEKPTWAAVVLSEARTSRRISFSGAASPSAVTQPWLTNRNDRALKCLKPWSPSPVAHELMTSGKESKRDAGRSSF